MKKVIGLFMALVVILMPTVVNAETNALPEAVNNTITLTDDVTLTSSYVVKSGEEITLDLAGYTIKTTEGLKADTIRVELGGKLTITGNGTITNSYNADGYAALWNNGTVIIDGATMKLDTTVNNNTYYVVVNHGVMTVNNANMSSNDAGSSMFENGYSNYSSTSERSGYVEGTNIKEPTLTINNGIFDGGMNTVKNDDNGIIEINNGTFTNTVQVSLMNWNVATINGGTFETPTGNDKTNIFVGNEGADSVDKGVLVINGGTFNAEHLLEGYKGVVTPVEINGGTFNYTDTFFNEDPRKSPTAFVNSGVEIVGEVTAPVSALVYAKDGAVVTLNEEVSEDTTITIPEGVTVILTETQEDNSVLVENTDGTYSVEEYANTTALEAILEKIEAITEEDYELYTEESLEIYLEGLTQALAKAEEISKDLEALGVEEPLTRHQAQVDEITKMLEEAYASLVLKETEEPSTPAVEPTTPVTSTENVTPITNPKTGDNILPYFVSGILSLCGLAVTKRFI